MGAVVSLSHLSLLLLPPQVLSVRSIPTFLAWVLCPSVSSSMVTASFRRLLRCGVLRGLQVISAAPRTSAGCRGIACLIIVLSTMAAEVFLLQCLKQNFHWPWGLLCYCCAAVFPLPKYVLLEMQSVTVTDRLGLGHWWFCFGAGCAGFCT